MIKKQAKIFLLFLAALILQLAFLSYLKWEVHLINLVLIFVVFLSYYSDDFWIVLTYSLLAGVVADFLSTFGLFGILAGGYLLVALFVFYGRQRFFRKKSLFTFLLFGGISLVIFLAVQYLEAWHFLSSSVDLNNFMVKRELGAYFGINLLAFILVWYGNKYFNSRPQ